MKPDEPLDYYAILGVPADADLSAIKHAYRVRALASHPDRGGSHEAMLSINAAGAILTNPERRRRYDQARSEPANHGAQKEAARDAESARQAAGQYPQDRNEFETWLDALAKDFTDAKYGDSGRFLTVENSNSGCLFVLVGAITGG